jgi:translocation and assembly module TamA
MGLKKSLSFKHVAFSILLASLIAGPVGPAGAFDFFGLFGREKPPEPSAERLPYEVQFAIEGDDDLKDPLQQASRLYGLRADAPPDADALVLRAQADLPRLIDALWGAGYYSAAVSIEVAGVPLVLQADRTGAASRAAQGFRARARVPIRIVVAPGERFVFRDIALRNARSRAPLPPTELPPGGPKIEPGDPAVAADILATEAEIVDLYRARSRPFAKVTKRDPVVFHQTGVMNVALDFDAGPVAGIGDITIRGFENVDPRVIRSFIYTEPGTPYSPRELADIRKSVLTIEALSSARIREADALDPFGNLPIILDVSERKPNVIGASASYSTVDGPLLRAYWANRNLFGGAERLRLEGSIFYAGRNEANRVGRSDYEWSDLGGRFTASFLKPALWGTRNDFLADAVALRETTDGYTSRLANVTAAIRHRWSDKISAQVGLEVEVGQASDAISAIDYRLIGIPASVQIDTTDKPLDPSRGFRLTAGVTPYLEAFGSTVGMTVGRAQASAYYAFDDEARYILAGRIGLGTIVGAELDEIPANRRFFAGGGGSVRGFTYRSLGPQALGQPIGGRSLFEASVEARIKITDTIGIVPFVDAGTAFESSLPDFGERVRVAAGLGLRYYTGIGPIRLDVATPIDGRQRGDKPVVLYVSIGQAF